MSLEIDGVWKSGVWATTVWADGVWYEGPPVQDSAAVIPGGWPSYGYRRKRKRIEEVEEKAEEQQEVIEAKTEKVNDNKRKILLLESRKRLKKADREILSSLKAGISRDLADIEEMKRIHDELLTLIVLEHEQDRRRRKRNQKIIIALDP